MPPNSSGGDTPEGPSQSPEGDPRENRLHSPKYQERVSLPGADFTENLRRIATDRKELGRCLGPSQGRGRLWEGVGGQGLVSSSRPRTESGKPTQLAGWSGTF